VTIVRKWDQRQDVTLSLAGAATGNSRKPMARWLVCTKREDRGVFQDYYALLGVPRTATEKRDPFGVSQAGSQAPPRRQSPATPRGRSEVSNRSTRRTKSCRILRSARSTISLGRAWKEYESWERAQAAAGWPAGAQAPQQPFDWTGGGRRSEWGRRWPIRIPQRFSSPKICRTCFGDDQPFFGFLSARFFRRR